jgi:hypothetical protein
MVPVCKRNMSVDGIRAQRAETAEVSAMRRPPHEADRGII